MYGLIWLMGLNKILEKVDLLILLTSAICHDLDHPGYNNAYQVIPSLHSININHTIASISIAPKMQSKTIVLIPFFLLKKLMNMKKTDTFNESLKV